MLFMTQGVLDYYTTALVRAGQYFVNTSLDINPQNFEVLSRIRTSEENLQLIISDEVILGALLFTDNMDAELFLNDIGDHIEQRFTFYSDVYKAKIDLIAVKVGENRFKMIYMLDSGLLLYVV
jgi:hypothetical protein